MCYNFTKNKQEVNDTVFNRTFKTFLVLLGGVIGIGGIHLIIKGLGFNPYDDLLVTYALYVCGFIISALIFYVLCSYLIRSFTNLLGNIEKKLQSKSPNELLIGTGGIIAGLLIANLISIPFKQIPVVGIVISIIFNIVFCYLGASVAFKNQTGFNGGASFFSKNKNGMSLLGSQPKILDTSVIIDGRIADICRTGFIEGKLIIPGFVLLELQHIADSSDSLKRNRGRRGLDILNLIQKELEIDVQIMERDFDDIEDVDSKILKLAEIINAAVITNDYNLNKVASFHGVPVLNINELSNAVKPIVLPGEEMTVTVVKDGKENGQGIAYLDDGTMIVVDGGKRYMGHSIIVLVTSVLQTPAGRMIFVKPKSEAEKAG
jgi:uncharacterized protein YacL